MHPGLLGGGHREGGSSNEAPRHEACSGAALACEAALRDGEHSRASQLRERCRGCTGCERVRARRSISAPGGSLATRFAAVSLDALFTEGLAELHTHLGGSVASDILWSLAHEQGIALPTRDFWEFDRMVTVSDPRGVPDLDSLDRIYHLTELIQSSPIAVERSVHGGDRRRLPLAAHHDARAALQPDEAKPRRRAATSTTSSWRRSAASTAPRSSTRRCAPG